MIKFWKWLKEYAERKEEEAYLDSHYCDQKCPLCNTWQGTVGGWREVVDAAEGRTRMTCNKCGQSTLWVDLGPVMTYVGVKA
jgi:transcription elongation factor Elf1